VVLDGEENKAVGVFLKQRLVCFLRLDCGCDTSLCDRLILRKIWDADNRLEDVLLVR
jgi:hypothetical protein